MTREEWERIQDEIVSWHFFHCTARKACARKERIHAVACEVEGVQPYATYDVKKARFGTKTRDDGSHGPFCWLVVRRTMR